MNDTVECIVDGRKEVRRIEHWEERVLPGEFQIGSGYSPSIYGKPCAVPEMYPGEAVYYDISGRPHICTEEYMQHNHGYYASGGTYGNTAGTYSDNTSNWQYRPTGTGDSEFCYQHVPPSMENPLGVIQVRIKNEEEEKVKQEENKFLAKLTRGMEEDQIDALYEVLEQPGWERRVMLAFLASAVKDNNMTMEVLGYEKSEE